MQLEKAIKTFRHFFRSHKRLPSYGEMCELFGFSSKKACFDLAKKLIAANMIEKDQSGKLIPKRLFALPVLGIVKAGYPTPAEEVLLDTMSFNDFLVGNPDRSYLLKVSGDSMTEAGIHSGDIVVLEKGKQPKNGDIVVAFVDNEWTLKYYRHLDNQVCLMPANPKYPTIYPKESLTIEGVVVSIMRKYH